MPAGRATPPRELIRSRSNPIVKRLRALKERVHGGGELALLEGPRLLEEALASGIEVVEVAAAPRLERAERGRRLLAELRQGAAPVHWLEDDLLESVGEAETSQGVVALVRRRSFREQDLYRGTPLIVVAVGIQNPGNLGGLLRTAEAAGATGAYLTPGTADPFAWKSLRGAMGSAFRMPHVDGVAADEVVARLKQSGVRTAAAQSAAAPYHDADLTQPLALFCGNEGSGLPESVLSAMDLRLGIPMAGAVESLNVGVAAGVLLFEAARQRRATMRP